MSETVQAGQGVVATKRAYWGAAHHRLGALGAIAEGVLRQTRPGALDVSVVVCSAQAARGGKVGDAISADRDAFGERGRSGATLAHTHTL